MGDIREGQGRILNAICGGNNTNSFLYNSLFLIEHSLNDKEFLQMTHFFKNAIAKCVHELKFLYIEPFYGVFCSFLTYLCDLQIGDAAAMANSSLSLCFRPENITLLLVQHGLGLSLMKPALCV